MTLWLLLTAMTAIAAVLVSAPFIRRYERARMQSGSPVALYRQQMDEVDREVKDGLIDTVEAETARTEIKRNLLAAEQAGERAESHLSSSERTFAIVSVAGIVVLGSVGLYAVTGNPEVPAAPAPIVANSLPAQSVAAEQPRPEPSGSVSGPAQTGQAQTGQAQTGLPPVDEMIQRLAARLEQNPQDVNGWRMLGWSYFSTEHFAEAAAAYAKAIALDPANAKLRASRVEALVRAAGGRVTADAAAAIEETLKLDSKNAEARFFRGLAKEQAGDKTGAFKDWADILKDADPSESWVPDLRQRVAALGKELGVSVSSQAPPPSPARSAMPAPSPPPPDRPTTSGNKERGPTAEDVRRAEAMAPADRTAMIRGMVDSLSARLEQNPRDAEGWIKLMRSRTVLGEQQIAREAFERALKAFSDDPTERERFTAEARKLGLLQ